MNKYQKGRMNKAIHYGDKTLLDGDTRETEQDILYAGNSIGIVHSINVTIPKVTVKFIFPNKGKTKTFYGTFEEVHQWILKQSWKNMGEIEEIGRREIWDSAPYCIGESLKDYYEKRIPCSHFLDAVLRNDLMKAVDKADLSNKRNLAEIVSWIFNNLPLGCYGSHERVENWLDGGK